LILPSVRGYARGRLDTFRSQGRRWFLDSQPRNSPPSDALGQAPVAATLPLAAADRRGEWWKRRSAIIAAAVFFIAMTWPFLRRGENSEFVVCYLRAARRLQAREIIHRDEPTAYAYPPAMAMLTAPLAQLPAKTALVVWYLVNVIAMSAVVAGAWRLLGGPPLAWLQGRWVAVFWLGVLLAFRFASAPLENQQFDVVIAALLIAGCLCLRRGRDLAGAVWLGAAAAMKCTPLLFAPYLAWRGRLKSACAMALVAVALNRLPDFLWPQAGGQSYLGDWCGTFLAKVGRSAPGVWDSDLVLNQSLSGLVNRFAQSGLPGLGEQLPSALAAMSPETVAWIRWWTYGTGLTLLAVTAWRFGRPGQPWRAACVDSRGDFDAGPSPIGLEAAALACLMLLLSPMSSKAHYVVLVLPCIAFARAYVERRDAWLRVLLPVLLLTGPLTSKGLTGKALGDLTLAWGFPTWFALALLLAVWRLLPANQADTTVAEPLAGRIGKAA
jgi:glycosyl transferase family 87